MNERVYPIEQIYVGNYQGKIKVVHYEEKLGYINLSSRKSAARFSEKFNEKFQCISLLRDFLKNNGLEALIINKDGNCKQYFKFQETYYIMKVLERRILFSQSNVQRIHFTSLHLAQIISDLLGFNITITPNTEYSFSEKLYISEVLVSGQKLDLFKKILISFIEVSLISGDSVVFTYEVGNRDYRISRSLNNAKIPQDGMINQNVFSVSLDENGKIKVNDVDIQEYVDEKGFQKTIKF